MDYKFEQMKLDVVEVLADAKHHDPQWLRDEIGRIEENWEVLGDRIIPDFHLFVDSLMR